MRAADAPTDGKAAQAKGEMSITTPVESTGVVKIFRGIQNMKKRTHLMTHTGENKDSREDHLPASFCHMFLHHVISHHVISWGLRGMSK